MPAYNGKGILSGEVNGRYNTGFGAFPAFNAFFLIMDNTAAFSVCQRARRTGNGAGPFIVTGQTMY